MKTGSLFFLLFARKLQNFYRQVFWLVPLYPAFPSRKITDSGRREGKAYKELTATGIAPDFNRIPFLIPLWKPINFTKQK